MQIEIERLGDVEIPLLDSLPPYRLARMEGYNGIGKSLTIRLLQLALGRQTFHQVRTWESFARGLGRVRVRVSQLEGAGELTWLIDGKRLPSVPSDVTDEWFQITMDGRDATLAEVSQVLSVHRLPGDVGLAETLGEQIEADGRMFLQWHAPLTAEGGPQAQALDLLDSLQSLVKRVDRQRLLDAHTDALEATTELERQREELRGAVARQTKLTRARALSNRLEEFAAFGADVDAQAAKVEEELTSIQLERAQANKRLAELESAAAKGQEARSRIRTIRRRLENHFAQLTVERLRESELLERARVTAFDEVAAAVSGVRTELDVLVERRAALHSTPLVRTLVNQIVELLASAEAAGLGDQVLSGANESSELVTVSEMRARLERREHDLAGVEPTAEGAALEAEIDALTDRIQALESLPAARAEVERRMRLVARAEAEINALVVETDDDAVAGLEDARARLAALDTQAAELARERTVLAIRKEAIGGGRSPEETSAELRALLSELDVPDNETVGQASAQDDVVLHLQSALHQTQARSNAARAAAAAVDDELRRVVQALADDESLTWAAEVQPIPTVDQDLQTQLDRLEALDRSVSTALERIAAIPAQVAAIDVALGRLANRLKGRREDSGGDRYLDELTLGYGEEFRGWFDDHLVRETLLPDARKVSSVDLRPERLEVGWETANGAHRSRTLDAFSRGEQAFAYTRARLASLDAGDQRATNRLIVLDEFGAFIARDRLDALVELIKERQEKFPADQVLLILPVAADYEEQAEMAISQEKDRLKPIVDSLAQKGYFAVEL